MYIKKIVIENKVLTMAGKNLDHFGIQILTRGNGDDFNNEIG